MPPMKDEEQARAEAREAIMLRMEEIATTNAESAQVMSEAAEAMSEQMADLAEKMGEIIEHLNAWEKFVNQFLKTYPPNESAQARNDFLRFMQGLFGAVGRVRR